MDPASCFGAKANSGRTALATKITCIRIQDRRTKERTMQIVTNSANFGSVSGSGPQTQVVNVNMGASVSKAVALLTGFNVEYSGNNDHHLGLLDVSVAVPPGAISGSNVAVTITYGLRDQDTNFDDAYDGQVFFTVVGE
jgi:hypothetical protein